MGIDEVGIDKVGIDKVGINAWVRSTTPTKRKPLSLGHLTYSTIDAIRDKTVAVIILPNKPEQNSSSHYYTEWSRFLPYQRESVDFLCMR